MSANAQPGFARSYFLADCSLGDNVDSACAESIVLCIDSAIPQANGQASGDATVNTFCDAIALAAQEPLLQCVANWLDQDFDWRPMTEHKSLPVDVTLSSADNALHQIGLSFTESMQALPAFPVELGELVAVQEHKQPLHICLANLNLSLNDQQRLQPGSCIVLPDTFKERNVVTLLSQNRVMPQVSATLEHRKNQLNYQITNQITNQRAESTINDATQSAENAIDQPVRIVLQQSIIVDLSQPLNQVVELDSLVGQAVVVQHNGADGARSYTAQLMEVGSGLAVLLAVSP